jgi:hypothetical protein
MHFFAEHQWLLFGAVFFGVIAYVAWIRRCDRLWIDRRYGLHNSRMMSFGVNYFGLASETAKRRSSSGFLLLLPDRLVYRSRFGKQPLEIPGDRISAVSHGTTLGGVKLHQPIIKIKFRTSGDGHDTAGFKVPYPPQWMAAIRAGFIDDH